MPTRQLLIIGKVQGVFYRASAKKTAQQLQLTGWIRNTKEGDVAAVVTGTEKAVQQFIDWCHHGPSGAKVTDVIVTSKEEEAFERFEIIR